MRYCAWLFELPIESTLHPEAAGLARLAQAGLPVLPGWVVLPTAAVALFGHPEVRVAIRREAKLVGKYPHAVSSATHSVRKQLHEAALPGDVHLELQQMLQQLRQHLVSPDQAIALRLRTDGAVIEREIADVASLETALKQLYSLQIKEEHFLEKKNFQATEAFINHISTDEVSGFGQLRDERNGDDTVIQITTGTQTFRIDRKSGVVLTAPAERENASLSEAQILDLARVIGKAQDLLSEPQSFGWHKLHGRVWLDGIRPLAQTKASLRRPITSAHSGLVKGIVRKIVSTADRQRLQPGEIAVIDRLRPGDYAWLSPATAVITAYGSHYGIPAQLGRRLGVPIVTGLTPTQLDRLWNGQLVTVNGHTGTIHTGASQVQTMSLATKLILHSDGMEAVNSSADGLLLTGSTGLLTLHALHPHQILRRERSNEYIELLSSELQEAAAALYPKPLFYRFHDGYLQGGQRGLHSALEQPEWLQVELRMLERAIKSGASNIIPLTPFLHTLDEVVRLRKFADKYPELLRRLWITCGTPAMAIQAEELGASDISGICLDLSHLARLTLGVANDSVRSHLARPDHAAVLQQADYLLGAASLHGIATMIDTDGMSLSQALIKRTVSAGADYLVVTQATLQTVEQMVAETESYLLQEYRLDAARPIC